MQKVRMMLQISYEGLFLRWLLVLPLIVAVYNVDCQVSDLFCFLSLSCNAVICKENKNASFSQPEDKTTDRTMTRCAFLANTTGGYNKIKTKGTSREEGNWKSCPSVPVWYVTHSGGRDPAAMSKIWNIQTLNKSNELHLVWKSDRNR
jgi:hypothetical protein